MKVPVAGRTLLALKSSRRSRPKKCGGVRWESETARGGRDVASVDVAGSSC